VDSYVNIPSINMDHMGVRPTCGRARALERRCPYRRGAIRAEVPVITRQSPYTPRRTWRPNASARFRRMAWRPGPRSDHAEPSFQPGARRDPAPQAARILGSESRSSFGRDPPDQGTQHLEIGKDRVGSSIVSLPPITCFSKPSVRWTTVSFSSLSLRCLLFLCLFMGRPRNGWGGWKLAHPSLVARNKH